MIIKNTGKIIDGLYMMGTPAMPVYLLDGEKPAIFDAGLTFLGNIYTDGIRKIIGNRDLQYCFLTHSHFDHCGSVSILKKNFPGLKVVASEKAKNVLGPPNTIELIRNLTQAGDVQKVIARIKEIQYDPIKGPKQIEAAYLLNLEAKVKAIKKRLENRSENLEIAN